MPSLAFNGKIRIVGEQAHRLEAGRSNISGLELLEVVGLR